MTSRYPLTLNVSSSTIEELPAAVNLDLTGSNISNVGNIAAGNSISANYFVGTLYGTANTANTSTTAATVTTNAQPNITSVGNLANLTVTGTSTLGNIGNVKITGGSNTQVIQTDGAGNLSFATIAAASFMLRPVRLATTDNIATLSGLNVVDGITVSNDDRVLVKNQITASQNGIYIASSGSWTRATDFTTGSETLIGGISVAVQAGTINTGTSWQCTNTSVITIGSTSITFVQQGINRLIASAGLGGAESPATGTGLSIGFGSGTVQNSLAVGANAVANATFFSTAIGTNSRAQQLGSTALGVSSNASGFRSVAIGGDSRSSTDLSLAVGYSAVSGGSNSISIGSSSIVNGANSIGIGQSALNTAANCVMIGAVSITNNNEGAIAVGYSAYGLGTQSIAIGKGSRTDGANSIAIGGSSGSSGGKGANSISIGTFSAVLNQGANAVAIGTLAGNSTQGANSIAIGSLAGRTSQANNSIILNATGANLDQTTANTFTVKPVREINNLSSSVLDYNTTTGEISSHLRTFGSFSSNATQTSNGANTTNYMTLNNTEDANGISIASSTQLTVARVGRYNIQFSAQLEKTDLGTDLIEIWLDKNGTAVANSATQIELRGNNAKEVAAWDFNVNAANVNDYFRIAWASPDANVQLTAITAANTISGVALPSVIVNINPIGA